MNEGTVIARGGLNLRRTPKTGRVIKALRRSSRLEILGEETWLRVRTRDGLEGFVLADFVELDPRDLNVEPSPAVSGAAEPETGVIQIADARAAEVAAAEPADDCDIRTYRNTRFIGESLRADRDFFPALDRLNGYAELCDVDIYVTSSTRESEYGIDAAVAPPARRSNHLVGHAIDFNLRSDSGFYNSRRLRRKHLHRLPPEIRRFIQMVRDDTGLRWGGDFDPEDPVHIDDGLNRMSAARWESKLASRA